MILFLEETKIAGLQSTFNVVIENQYLEDLFLERTDFFDTEMKKTRDGGYSIRQKKSEGFELSLKLEEIKEPGDIFSVTWENNKTLVSSFSTYNHIPDMETFLKEKKLYEDHLNVKLVDIRKADIEEVEHHIHSDFPRAAIEIMRNQKKVEAPGILYSLFREVLGETKVQTLKKITFI